MLKTLLHVNEDLDSSIALRYTAYLHKFVPLSLYISHVERADEKERVGTGWIRPTWEDSVASNGKRLIERLLRTENIDCPLAGRPTVFVGDRDKEVSYELRNGLYDLFIEGCPNSPDPDQFYELVSSPLYINASCPMLVVKNISINKKCALLCADNVNPKVLVEKSMAILGDSTFTFDVIHFKINENKEFLTLANEDGGSCLRETESLLAKHGKSVNKALVLSGSPEQAGDYLKNYTLVASTLPTRKSITMDILAHSPASVLMVH